MNRPILQKIFTSLNAILAKVLAITQDEPFMLGGEHIQKEILVTKIKITGIHFTMIMAMAPIIDCFLKKA